MIGAVRAIEGSRQSAPRLTVGTASRDRATPRTQFLAYPGERGALPGSPIVVWCRTEAVPTALDNGQRSTKKMLAAVVRRVLYALRWSR